FSAALKKGEDNAELSELYEKLLDQWGLEMEHVVGIVGGSETREKYGGQPGPRFTPLPRARQQAAVRFINENAFRTPDYFVDTQILRRIEPEGTLRRIGSAQARVLASLLETDRLNRLSEYEAISHQGGGDPYRLAEMLGDVRRGIWGELSAGRVSVDPFRRSLQRAYVSQADTKVNPSPAIIITTGPPSRGARASPSSGANSDVRALMRGELIELDAALRSAQGRAANRTTRLHIMDMRNEIRRILDPER
ncbi:MAG: zinc-dependent metalloprotease, partial [Anaerolineae bacterium]|nr:zinc-dependent metalloprotease [Gemmatimonadaceae bacterium]